MVCFILNIVIAYQYRTQQEWNKKPKWLSTKQRNRLLFCRNFDIVIIIALSVGIRLLVGKCFLHIIYIVDYNLFYTSKTMSNKEKNKPCAVNVHALALIWEIKAMVCTCGCLKDIWCVDYIYGKLGNFSTLHKKRQDNIRWETFPID